MLLGLDLGTTNVKALLAGEDGSVVAVGSEPVGLEHVGADGVEQDIEDIWRATLAAIGRLAAGNDLSGVRAVGVSAQGGAILFTDAEGRPLGPVISWLDGRGKPWDEKLTAELGGDWFAERIGCGRSGIAVGQVLRIRDQHPELLAAPNRVAHVGDTIVARLSGRAAHDATSLALCMMYNPALGAADPDMLDRLGITADRLPDLLPADSPAGGLLADVAGRTSLPAGIPVSPAMHDQYAAAIGCGAVHAGDVMFGAGTAWVLLAVVGQLARPVIDAAFVCTHPVAGLYGQMFSLTNGGSSLSWAARTLGLAEGADLDGMMQSVPPGSEGLRFRPLLVAGGGAGLPRGTPGRLDGLRLSHTPAHILRAVVEGLACELSRYLGFVTGAGLPVERLVMCGGAAASKLTPQIIADMTGLPISCTTEAETSALGAAVVARSMVEADANLAGLSEDMAPDVRVVTPGPAAAQYRRILEQYLAELPRPPAGRESH